MVRHGGCPLPSPASAVLPLAVATLLLSCSFDASVVCEGGGSALSRDQRGVLLLQQQQHGRLMLLPAPPPPPSASSAGGGVTLQNVPTRINNSRMPTKQERASYRRLPPSSPNPTQNKSKPRNDGAGNRKNLRGRRR